MRKFIFRFQVLLDTKKHFEEKCENELAISIRKEHEEEALLEEIKAKFAHYRNEYVLYKETSIDEIKRYRNYFDRLINDMVIQRGAIEKAEEYVRLKREELVAFRKERRALEKLREKDYREHQKEMMIWERKFMDDVAASAYTRRIVN